MKRGYQTLILSGVAIVVVILALTYYGFHSSFKNFGGGGRGYPLAMYDISVEKEKVGSSLDSISTAEKYTIQTPASFKDREIKYLEIFSASLNDSITFEIEIRQDSITAGRTKIILWSVLSRKKSITVNSMEHDDKDYFSWAIKILKSTIVDKIESGK